MEYDCYFCGIVRERCRHGLAGTNPLELVRQQKHLVDKAVSFDKDNNPVIGIADDFIGPGDLVVLNKLNGRFKRYRREISSL